jgi:hypothetical protein
MHCSALSPEAERKGKTDIRCKVVIVTTNTYDLHASYFSINPASIMRRFDLIVDAKLLDDAKSSTGGIHPKFAGTPYPDAWKLDLGRVKIRRSTMDNLSDTYHIESMNKTNIVGLVNYLDSVVVEHFDVQGRIVDASTELHKKPHCELHPLFPLPCAACHSGNIACHGGIDEINLEEDHFETAHEVLDGQTGNVASPNQYDAPWGIDNFIGQYFSWDEMSSEEDDKQRTIDWAEGENFEVIPMTCVQRIKYLTGNAIADTCELVKAARAKIKPEPWMVTLGVIASLGASAFGLYAVFHKERLSPEGAIISRIEAASAAPGQFVEKDNKYRKVYSHAANASQASTSSTWTQVEKNQLQSSCYTCQRVQC